MSTSNYVTNYFEIERRQADAAARKMSTRRVWGATMGCLLLFALLDFLFVFPQPVRLAACGAFIIVVMWQLTVWRRARARLTSSKQVAAHVEQKSGQETVVLTTAADDHVRASLAGHELGTTVLERLDDHAKRLAVAVPVDFGRPARTWKWTVLALSCVFLLFGVMGGFRSYGRILLPWLSLPYTRVELRAPADKIPVLSTFQLTGAVKGWRTTDARLHRSFDDQVSPVVLREDGSFAIDLPGVSEDCSFWVTAGDGVSRRIEIRTFSLTEINVFRVAVTPPDYASRLAKTEAQPNFEVLRGSSLDYQIQLSKPVREVNLVPSPDGEVEPPAPIRFSPTDDPLVFRARLPNLSKDLNYRIAIQDHKGDISRNDEPYRVLVMADEPPQLKITGHNAKQVLKQGDEDVTVKVKATDDVALTEMRLVYRKVGKSGAITTLPIDDKKPFEFTVASLMKLAPLELEPLDVVIVHAEGTDGNVLDGPGVGKSPAVMFEVPEPPPEQQANSEGGGGGGGQQVNPLEMQKYILEDTSKLAGNESAKVFEEIRQEQDEVNGFVETLLTNVRAKSDVNPRARGIAAQLELALSTMRLSARQLNKVRRDESLLAQEFAVATLTQAAKMMGGPT